MNAIAKFFTLYWMIYFPTCIAFNDLPGFSSIDEIMTVVLIGYTFLKKNHCATNNKPWREFFIFLGILACYIVYSLIRRINVPEAVWLEMVQQIRPYSIIYCTWILNPQFTERQKKWMLGTMLISLAAFIVYNPTVGDVRNSPLGQLSICTAMTYYLFTKKTRANLWFTVIIATMGLLSMKFKYYGEYGVFMYLLLFMKSKLNFKSPKIVFQVAVVVAIAVIMGWKRFDTYYVSGLNNEELARPMMYKTSLKILVDYFPLGSGMGTFSTAASAVYYSPLYTKYGLNDVWGLNSVGGFIGDTFYPSLAQFGIVGIALFLLFWIRRLNSINKICSKPYYLVGLMAVFCLAIEQTADSSWLSGKGMGYCMLIGLCLNANRNLQNSEKKKQIRAIEHKSNEIEDEDFQDSPPV